MISSTTSVAKPTDLEALLPLIRGYQSFYNIADVSETQTRAFFGAVIERESESFIMLARSGDELVGFATGYITLSGYLARRLVHMGDLFVCPEIRRRGVGRALIKAVSEHALARGLTTIRWLTSPTNTEACRLYESIGAVPSEHRLYLLNAADARFGES